MDIETAIRELERRYPQLRRGEQAQPGHPAYERGRGMTFHLCHCAYADPHYGVWEFAAVGPQGGGYYVGVYLRGGIISVGPKGYHQKHPPVCSGECGTDQFSNLRGTGILPVAEKHGQDARATENGVTELQQLVDPGGKLPVNPPICKIPVAFDPEPYTLVPVQRFRQVWSAPERKSSVVYLWCIEYHGDYLVNYVGKTWDNRGFDYRLWSQLLYWRNDHCDRCDVEAFKGGRRIVVPKSQDPEQLRRELRELEPLYRIFLARIPQEHCLSVENEIAHSLQGNPATSQFLCNKNPYPHDPAVEILPQGNPPIIGLTVPIPQSLQ